MATIADPTVEFMAQFDDESKWLIKRRVPIFKPHEGMKKDKSGTYRVTSDDLPALAKKMHERQTLGLPSRLTVGHVDTEKPETSQPAVIGWWLNPEPGTFGPNNEPCILADSYVKAECADEVKGRPYRSAEYYPLAKEITGVAVLARDPRLDMGTVELYALPDGAVFCPDIGESDMPETTTTPEAQPLTFERFTEFMERYEKSKATPEPAKPKDSEAERMTRDDESVNYARLSAEITELRKARESDRETIVKLTKERDREQCERMVRTLQAERYELKETTAELVDVLSAMNEADRERHVATIRKYAPKGIGNELIEVYSGKLEEPGKAKPVALDASQAARAASYAKGDNARYEKARSALLAGQPLED